MTTILKEVDAVVIGVGWTGSIMARELTKAGLNVVGLERGAKRMPSEDFTLPNVRDDLKYSSRQELFQDAQEETVTFRHSPSEAALPVRRLGSFLPGTGLGGAGSHWNGLTWRLQSGDRVSVARTGNTGNQEVTAGIGSEVVPIGWTGIGVT